ncbi:MAG: DNA-methyltransferase [Terriglobales bacterium]
MPDNSIDSVVTDPPYDLTANKKGGTGAASLNLNHPGGRSRITTGGGFMGAKWDGTGIAFRKDTWEAVLRVAKPGAYLLTFGGSRTFHRMACAIEDAGWTLQDTLCWLYGSGFPKHKSKLKPAYEPIIMAWKPDRYATPLPGLDACRINSEERPLILSPPKNGEHAGEFRQGSVGSGMTNDGRWPANLVLDEEAAAMLDEQSGVRPSGAGIKTLVGSKIGNGITHGAQTSNYDNAGIGGDTGGASRFFYTAKASRSERDAGCEDINLQRGAAEQFDSRWKEGTGEDRQPMVRNTHPTVKPLDLIRYLCRLITPPGGTILDCFMGSGTTGLAAMEEKFKFIGIEREEAYFEIARRRIAAPMGPLFGATQ